jgi:hypothetical protein
VELHVTLVLVDQVFELLLDLGGGELGAGDLAHPVAEG